MIYELIIGIIAIILICISIVLLIFNVRTKTKIKSLKRELIVGIMMTIAFIMLMIIPTFELKDRMFYGAICFHWMAYSINNSFELGFQKRETL